MARINYKFFFNRYYISRLILEASIRIGVLFKNLSRLFDYIKIIFRGSQSRFLIL